MGDISVTRRELFSLPVGTEGEINNRVINEQGEVVFEPCKFRIIGQNHNNNPLVAQELAQALMYPDQGAIHLLDDKVERGIITEAHKQSILLAYSNRISASETKKCEEQPIRTPKRARDLPDSEGVEEEKEDMMKM